MNALGKLSIIYRSTSLDFFSTNFNMLKIMKMSAVQTAGGSPVQYLSTIMIPYKITSISINLYENKFVKSIEYTESLI